MNPSIVRKLLSTKGSYAYVLVGSDPILVDTSLPGRADRVIEEIRDLAIETIRHIVITHYDVDHIGNLAVLARHFGATVWLPTGDVPYILGQRPRPGIKRLVGALMRVAPPESFQMMEPGGRVGTLVAVGSPGHTPGHLAFRAHEYLFVGDAFRTGARGVHPSPGILSWNRDREAASRKALLEDFHGWLLPAHGEPILWPMEG